MTRSSLPNPATNSVDKMSVYIAAGLVSGCGALMFNVMPVFVGAMTTTLNFNEARLGDIIAWFNVGFTLSALSAVFWVGRVSWRIASGLAVVMAAGTLTAMASEGNYAVLAALMTAVGLSMGSLYAIVLAVLGESGDPDRAFGLKLGLETLPGALLLFLLPVYIAPAFGFAGVAYAMAAVILALGLSIFFLPHHGAKGQAAHIATASVAVAGSNAALPIMALCSSLLFFTGISATWAFLELLAYEKALSPDAVGTVLAVSFIVCGIGGFVAAAVGSRFGRIPPMAGIILANLAGLWFLGHFSDIPGYAVGSGLFLFSVNFTLAYTFGLTAEVDSKGRLIVLSAAGLSLGAIIGPATAGRLIEAAGYHMVLGFSATCSLTALAIYLLVLRLAGRRAGLMPAGN